MKKTEEFMKPKTTFGDILRFTPYAYAKLLWMRDRGDTEVAGYCVTETEDPLLVTDFVLIKQECTSVSFDLDPDDGVEYMEQMMDRGLPPWAFANILAHTHPGNSPSPSDTDEENFVKAFSHPNWAIMFIIADGGATYCRMKINVGPGSVNEIGVTVDWGHPFGGTDIQAWEEEYKAKVVELVKPKCRMTGKEGKGATVVRHFPGYANSVYQDPADPAWFFDKEDRWGTLSEATSEELNRIGEEGVEVDDSIDFDCHWDNNGDVAYWDNETCTWFFFDPVRNQWWIERDDEGSTVEEIERPTHEWVTRVEKWSLQFSGERVGAMEV